MLVAHAPFTWKCPREGSLPPPGRMGMNVSLFVFRLLCCIPHLELGFPTPFSTERITDESVWNGTLSVCASFPVICIPVQTQTRGAFLLSRRACWCGGKGCFGGPLDGGLLPSAFRVIAEMPGPCRCVGGHGHPAAEGGYSVPLLTYLTGYLCSFAAAGTLAHGNRSPC